MDYNPSSSSSNMVNNNSRDGDGFHQSQPPSDEGYRPLNVRDALSYLDQVKLRFQDNPEVYNHFLDTMKDFKSQSIDTPGVIDRVSTLFRGHPALIQGFNTFLPPGYRIECSDLSGTSPSGGTITVTTPMGITTLQASASFLPAWQQQQQQQQQIQSQHPPQQIQQQPQQFNNQHISHSPKSPNQFIHHHPHHPHHQLHSGANTPTAASTLAGQKPPVEFNHAINYVNKIKNRFNQDPETYKMFLEVLQTYQKEQRTIHEVYAQVNHLFHGAPDLLDEFKQFLPDTTGNAQSGGLFQMVGQLAPATSTPQSVDISQTSSRGINKKNNFNKLDEQKTKKKRAPVNESQKLQSKKTKHVHRMEMSPPPQSMQQSQPIYQHQPSTQTINQQPVYSNVRMEDNYVYSPLMQSNTLIQPSIPIDKTLATIEEMAFFDRVKKFIDDKTTYHEFLKLLNLFTQDIIDARTLIDRSQLFIGENKELWDFFKAMVGIVPGPGSGGPGGTFQVDNIPAIERPKIELEECKKYGASYRKLPQSEVSLSCSGRDAMCWEVLNDEWVSHPTWASEDSGFVAHRKNHFEEALHKSEEERHEYDYHIEANLRTIALLEPIAARISAMDNEERSAFRLKPGLGGQSKSIYQRIIKKVYGRENGLEIINALHENPAVAVPVILNRLKAKDEEWKRAQREWNKVWRELDARNFYKSLDHQGIVWKSNEKKNLTSKQLIIEIETLRKEQIQKRKATLNPISSNIGPIRARYQMSFKIEDETVLFDAIKLILAFIDRPVINSSVNNVGTTSYSNNQSVYSSSERERYETVLRDLIQAFFKIDDAKFEDNLSPSAGSSNSVNRNNRNNNNNTNNNNENESSNSQNDNKNNGNEGDEPWTNLQSEQANTLQVNTNSNLSDKSRKHFNFFCNSTYYITFRLFYILYSRLYNFKLATEELSRANHKPLNPLAKELGINDPTIPSQLGIPLFEKGENPSEHFYNYLLELCERLFEGEVDQNLFEESIRWMFGTKAYPMFTIDKLISQILKQLSTMSSDGRCHDLLNALQIERKDPSSSNSRQFVYRNKVQKIIGNDENLYRIEWVEKFKEIRMQLLAREDLTVDVDERKQSQDQRWTYYIQSYILPTPTEGLVSDLSAPFLYRNIPSNENEDDEDDDQSSEEHQKQQTIDQSQFKNSIQMKICMRSYRMFFVPNTEDSFYIKKSGPNVTNNSPGLRFGNSKKFEENLKVSNENRKKRFDHWLKKFDHLVNNDDQQQELSSPNTNNQNNQDTIMNEA